MWDLSPRVETRSRLLRMHISGCSRAPARGERQAGRLRSGPSAQHPRVRRWAFPFSRWTEHPWGSAGTGAPGSGSPSLGCASETLSYKLPVASACGSHTLQHAMKSRGRRPPWSLVPGPMVAGSESAVPVASLLYVLGCHQGEETLNARCLFLSCKPQFTGLLRDPPGRSQWVGRHSQGP